MEEGEVANELCAMIVCNVAMPRPASIDEILKLSPGGGKDSTQRFSMKKPISLVNLMVTTLKVFLVLEFIPNFPISAD